MSRKLIHPPASAESPLLSVEEAAGYLKVSVRTLDVWRCTGRWGIPYLKVGGRVRYRRTDLEKWLAERTRGSVSAGA